MDTTSHEAVTGLQLLTTHTFSGGVTTGCGSVGADRCAIKPGALDYSASRSGASLMRLLTNLNPRPSTLNPQPSTLNHQPSTLHTTHYTLHPVPYTLHPTPCTLVRLLTKHTFLGWYGGASEAVTRTRTTTEREFFNENLLIRIHLIIEMNLVDRSAMRHWILNSVSQATSYLPSSRIST